MNILPQKYSDFKDKNYWNSFYSSLKNTQNEHFQWYGNYQDFKFIFHDPQYTFISPKQQILHVGCGKSTFGEDLYREFKIQEGFQTKIVNCDYSQEMVDAMKKRLEGLQDPTLSNNDKQNIKYQVCDLLTDFQINQTYQKYTNNFDTIIDKGTLDALLPEDKEQHISKIIKFYFRNLELCLRKQGGKILIISMLQEFILRTIIEYFFEENPSKINNYTITIYQCIIKDSKMQPFLVSLNKSQQKCGFLLFRKLGTKETEKLYSKQDVIDMVLQTQRRSEYTYKIQSLIPGQRTKYKVFNQDANNSVRYLIQMIDSDDKILLNKNNCAVYIVPQGSENAYHFDDPEGIKELHNQIGTSRLLLTKLMPGNIFKSIQQVKKQLNSVLPNLIQKQCKTGEVPYLMNAEQLGKKNALFSNNQIILDEVLVSGEPYRRLFLKSNLNYNQSQFKLCYNGNNSLYAKYSKKSNSTILPLKKNMVIGIDKQELADDTAQTLYSGITGFLGENRINRGCKILIEGEQFALAKFLVDNFQAIQIKIITTLKTIKQFLENYLQLQQSQKLQIIVVQNSVSEYLEQYPEDKYDIVVLVKNNKEGIESPSIAELQDKVVKISEHLVQDGLFICHYWNFGGTQKQVLLYKILGLYLHPLYSYLSSYEQDDNNIVFGLKYPINHNKDSKTIIHEQLIKLPKNKINKYQWQKQQLQGLKVVWPNIMDKESVEIDKETKFEDVYNKAGNKQKKNKNKKKK